MIFHFFLLYNALSFFWIFLVKRQFIIGIDPGKKTGYAVFDCKGGVFTRIETSNFWDVYLDVIGLSDEYDISVFIEVSTKSHVWHHRAGVGRMAKVGQDVGGVRVMGQLLVEGFERYGLAVKQVEPGGKVGAEHFEAFSGFVGRTSQHGRDAAMMVLRNKSLI